MKLPVMAYSSRPVGLAAPRLVPLGRGRVMTLEASGLYRTFGFWHNNKTGSMGCDLIFDSNSDFMTSEVEQRFNKHSADAVADLRSAGRAAGMPLATPPIPEFWVKVVGDVDISSNSSISQKAIVAIMDLVSGADPVVIPAVAKRWGKITSVIRDLSEQSQLDYEPAGAFIGEGNAQTLPDPELSGDTSPDSQRLSHLVNLHSWIKPGATVEKGAILGYHGKDRPWTYEDVWGLPNVAFDWLLNILVNRLVDHSPDPEMGLIPMWLVPTNMRQSPEYGGCVQEIFEMGTADHKSALRTLTCVKSEEGVFDFDQVV